LFQSFSQDPFQESDYLHCLLKEKYRKKIKERSKIPFLCNQFLLSHPHISTLYFFLSSFIAQNSSAVSYLHVGEIPGWNPKLCGVADGWWSKDHMNVSFLLCRIRTRDPSLRLAEIGLCGCNTAGCVL
jgi:hypothetical protein